MPSGRAGKLEFAIGVLFLFHLVLIVAVLLAIQSRFDLARFGISQTADEGVKTPNITLGAYGTTDLPAAGDAETYDTDNLYEKIDGKAPMYQEAGFESLTTQRFASGQNTELGFEIYLYDMGNSRNAFSVYSRQKRADATDLPDIPFGYRTSNAIYVACGKYYIEMIGFAESDDLVSAMKGIARKLSGKLGISEGDKIAELELFPSEGTVAGSWRLQLRDAFGFDGLTDTYSAQYRAGEKAVTIFFSRRAGIADAQAVAGKYQEFLTSNGAKVISPDSEALKSANASVLDFYGSVEIVFATGTFVGGVHEAEDRQAAEKVAEVLIGQLKEIDD